MVTGKSVDWFAAAGVTTNRATSKMSDVGGFPEAVFVAKSRTLIVVGAVDPEANFRTHVDASIGSNQPVPPQVDAATDPTLVVDVCVLVNAIDGRPRLVRGQPRQRQRNRRNASLDRLTHFIIG